MYVCIHVCMYVCMHVGMYVCMYVSMYVWVCIFVCRYARVCVIHISCDMSGFRSKECATTDAVAAAAAAASVLRDWGAAWWPDGALSSRWRSWRHWCSSSGDQPATEELLVMWPKVTGERRFRWWQWRVKNWWHYSIDVCWRAQPVSLLNWRKLDGTSSPECFRGWPTTDWNNDVMVLLRYCGSIPETGD